MAAYPEVQLKVQEELDRVLTSRELTFDDFQHLPYTEASLYETERIRPIVPVGIPHGATEDTEFCGYYIPRSTMLICPLWSLHMDEEVWKDPHVFMPERFLNEEGKLYRPDHFMPFQVGEYLTLQHFLLFL